MATEETAVKIEKQVKELQSELEIVMEAKSAEEACTSLCEYAEQKEEPFTTVHAEPNEWHKSAGGGGGCNIL